MRHVRLATLSGLHLGVDIGRRCARCGLMHRSKRQSPSKLGSIHNPNESGGLLPDHPGELMSLHAVVWQ